MLPRMSLGAMPPNQTPLGPITLPNAATGDLIFMLSGNNPYYQFSQYEVVSTFTSGQQGTVQILQTGSVQFSAQDCSQYAGQAVTLVVGDLVIDHGVSIRLFRSVVDLDAQTPGVKDVTAILTRSRMPCG